MTYNHRHLRTATPGPFVRDLVVLLAFLHLPYGWAAGATREDPHHPDCTPDVGVLEVKD